MTESEFNQLVDATLGALELGLDRVEQELDYETGGGVLTIEFDNDTTMVFSRQPPSQQLWLAARAGGFHFNWDEEAGDWRGTRDGELLRPFVVEQMRAQAGVEFD